MDWKYLYRCRVVRGCRSAISTFGGAVPAPAFDKLSGEGLR